MGSQTAFFDLPLELGSIWDVATLPIKAVLADAPLEQPFDPAAPGS